VELLPANLLHNHWRQLCVCHYRLRKIQSGGKQFIIGNSHHSNVTLKSILVGEAIRLRRLNQRKEGYLNSLNRFREKAIRSNVMLEMTNDMIAMPWNWRENSCIYCLQVCSSFDLVSRSYKSVTRDFCRKQIYCNRQRQWCKTHSYMFPGKLLNFEFNRALRSAISRQNSCIYCL